MVLLEALIFLSYHLLKRFLGLAHSPNKENRPPLGGRAGAPCMTWIWRRVLNDVICKYTFQYTKLKRGSLPFCVHEVCGYSNRTAHCNRLPRSQIHIPCGRRIREMWIHNDRIPTLSSLSLSLSHLLFHGHVIQFQHRILKEAQQD